MPQSRECAIVGAGLVGSLLSVELARRGWKVTAFEKRPDMRRESISAGRSINLAVSARGLHALDQVGLKDRVLQQAMPMQGRMIHPVKGELSFQPYGKNESECIYSISRGDLNKTLMTAAEETGRVEIRFNTRLEASNLSSGELRLVHERTNEASTHVATKIFGTDGASGALRKAILEQKGAQGKETFLDYSYKELLILPAEGTQKFKLAQNALHIWPRGNFMLIALPNHDGSFTVTLFLPTQGPHPSFETLTSPHQVRSFFEEVFPDSVSVLEDLEGTFFANPTGRMVTLHTDPWNFEERALLVGDAAHAIVPFFGQGMNCGFEDVTLLMSAIDAGKPNLFGNFSRSRKPDADAIATMALENFIEMRDKVGDPKFIREKEIEKIIARDLGGRYLSRYSLVSFHRVPYRVALEIGRVQDQILEELGRGLEEPQQVDLSRARRMVEERLSPLFERNSSWT